MAETIEDSEAPKQTPGPSKPRLWRMLGPGLITGASDDDPSGIATYSQAGAQFGYTLGWTLLLTWPLMAAIQMIAARLGRTTGHGIAGVLRRHYPVALLQAIVAALLIANIINIGANLGAMADATRLVIGGSSALWLLGFGALCIVLQVFMQYTRYVRMLKYLTVALFAYVATLFLVEIDWPAAVRGLAIPTVTPSRETLTTIVAILGTTISPYLFFWQASEEAEDVRVVPGRRPLNCAPSQAPMALERIRIDTLIGMGFSNAIALAIVITAAAALNGRIERIQSSAQAAEALRPVAGPYAELIFALGIIGTGFLAIPVLAGSAAYALAEARHWRVGLARKPREASGFYATIATATAIGMVLNFMPVNPIQALYWSAVINGVVAVPVMFMLMLASRNRSVMGQFAVGGLLAWLGWASAGLMAAAVGSMLWVIIA
ncbi:MAG: divalent metal cation transporter [Alphaproteobacteria bacterium]|nr:divalent metal cation transporter [Alphaproteobacteria bacterium]MCW5744004.1 divalent metal cation transporter [Alphaproteobacteria bacterium]